MLACRLLPTELPATATSMTLGIHVFNTGARTEPVPEHRLEPKPRSPSAPQT
jgi:hypothetical protein